LTNVSNPDSDCLELIEAEDKKIMIQRLATLMINDSGFIASLLVGNGRIYDENKMINR